MKLLNSCKLATSLFEASHLDPLDRSNSDAQRLFTIVYTLEPPHDRLPEQAS
jgi:hypothetical protein